MADGNTKNNSFTLPGEAGYEKLTIELAEKWGADVIRDSDGTVLSEEITNSGYGIYSTICIIRDHNAWAKENQDKLQGTFLMTVPRVAAEDFIEIKLMEDFFDQQFSINETPASIKYWQVYDRTTKEVIDCAKWEYRSESRSVVIKDIKAWHKYSVSFLAYRIWEEISMYNHTTNHWDKEHLMQIDPRYPETQAYLLGWMKKWCEEHPATTVVRFTSMFYNFVWIWGSSERNRHLFTDWASYDFTVSPLALDIFKERYGYALTAEDFINQGKLQVTHMPCDQHKKDWMEFTNDFIISFGKKLIDMVHEYGKKAYVFYDDSWVGVEPYGDRFEEFGFDGIIKAVFSAYEARLAGGVRVNTHELRLHPYLFPVGVDGSPSFLENGNPTLEAKIIWKEIRRAILREPIDRLGLGGYLHLVTRKPDFIEYIAQLADEFRLLKELHKEGAPVRLKPRVAVLHFWGKLRSWSLSGHFHETSMHDLIHINEALAGLPFDVRFINFEDIRKGVLNEIDVVINAGYAGSAWSGGEAWKDEEIVAGLTKWVYGGGVLIGVNEPSAVEGYDNYFRMAHVLGIDEDTGARICHGRWSYELEAIGGILTQGSFVHGKPGRYLTDGSARVLLEDEGSPALTMKDFGKGKGIYLSSFERNPANNRMLMNLMLYAAGEDLNQCYLTDNPYTECAYYPNSGKLVIINNSDTEQSCKVRTEQGEVSCTLEAYGVKFC